MGMRERIAVVLDGALLDVVGVRVQVRVRVAAAGIGAAKLVIDGADHAQGGGDGCEAVARGVEDGVLGALLQFLRDLGGATGAVGLGAGAGLDLVQAGGHALCVWRGNVSDYLIPVIAARRGG